MKSYDHHCYILTFLYFFSFQERWSRNPAVITRTYQSPSDPCQPSCTSGWRFSFWCQRATPSQHWPSLNISWSRTGPHAIHLMRRWPLSLVWWPAFSRRSTATMSSGWRASRISSQRRKCSPCSWSLRLALGICFAVTRSCLNAHLRIRRRLRVIWRWPFTTVCFHIRGGTISTLWRKSSRIRTSSLADFKVNAI